jgi:RNA polymerase sigma factor (sigma-70 family)
MNDEGNHFSDKDIVTNILNGNIQDFAVVVKNTEKLVTQIVRKMTTKEEDQKDLVQDIYLKAYQNLSSFQFKSKLSTWIANIAYNTTVNYLQKRKIPIIELEKSLEGNISSTDQLEFEIFKIESLEILNIEINKLPPLYKTLINLYHLEALPVKEISEITKLPEGTIKSYLSRARATLKTNIHHYYKMNIDEK